MKAIAIVLVLAAILLLVYAKPQPASTIGFVSNSEYQYGFPRQAAYEKDGELHIPFAINQPGMPVTKEFTVNLCAGGPGAYCVTEAYEAGWRASDVKSARLTGSYHCHDNCVGGGPEVSFADLTQTYTNNNDATVGINTNAYCPAALTLPAGCYVYRDGFWGNGELILSKTSTVQLEPPSTPPATPPSTPPAQQPEPPASNYTTPVIPSSGSSLLDNMRSAFWGFVAWIRSLFP